MTAVSEPYVFFECIDHTIPAVVDLIELDTATLNEIQALLARPFDLSKTIISLSTDEVATLRRRTVISSRFNFEAAQLHVIDPADELPYLDHTDRELALMARGRKKFAFFIHRRGDLSPVRYFKLFDQLVDDGDVVLQEFGVEDAGKLVPRESHHQLITRLYALRGEEWRIPAYVMLRNNQAHQQAWSYDYERVLGCLLGYSNYENDKWREFNRARDLEWLFTNVYIPVSDPDVTAIRCAGSQSLILAAPRDLRCVLVRDLPGEVFKRMTCPQWPRLVRMRIPNRMVTRELPALTEHMRIEQNGEFIVPAENVAALAAMSCGYLRIWTEPER